MPKPSLQIIAQMPKEQLHAIKELDFSIAVREYAEAHGWLVAYQKRTGYLSRNGQWRGMAPKGEPDLRMVRRKDNETQVLFIELKAERGRVSPEQDRWLEALGEYGWCWKPRHAEIIMEALR